MHENPRESKARPGTRAPHVWLERAAEKISTLDLFGRNFVLLAGLQGIAWCEGAQEVARTVKVPLDIWRIGSGGLRDPESVFPKAYGLQPDGAVLVRPDGFDVWRAGASDQASPEIIRGVLDSVLCGIESTYCATRGS